MDVTQMINSLAREVEKRSEEIADTIFNAPEAEVLVKTATNNDQWGPSGTEMSKISDLTHRHQELRIVMDALWLRITEKKEGKNWRNVYKGLLLLDYLLKNGSEKVVSETRARIYELKQLGRFNYVDSQGVDRGLSVRERTKQIIDLAHDTERLKEERKNAKRNRGKFQGLSSDGAGTGHFSSQDHFKRTDPHYGVETNRTQKKSAFDDSDEGDFGGGAYPSKGGAQHNRKPSRTEKKRTPGGGSNFFDESDSDEKAAKTVVPKKEAWEPFGSKKPVAKANADFDDEDWEPFTPAVPSTTSNTSAGLPNVGALHITPQSPPAVTAPATGSPGLLLLTPTNSTSGGQPTFLSSTGPASATLPANHDPWASGVSQLFSFDSPSSSTANNNKLFGATGSTFSTSTATPPTSNFGSASGIPTTYPSYTGGIGSGYAPPPTGGYPNAGVVGGYPVAGAGVGVAPGYGYGGAPAYGAGAGAYGYGAPPPGY